MNLLSRTFFSLGLAATLAIGACGGDGAETNTADTTAGDDTMNYTPADSGLPTNADSNSTAGADSVGQGDVGVDSAGATGASGAGTTGGDGTSLSNNDLAEMVSAQLMVLYSDVKVRAEGDGVVVLTGTVASEQEKKDAEAEAKKIVGVKSVRNEITVK